MEANDSNDLSTDRLFAFGDDVTRWLSELDSLSARDDVESLKDLLARIFTSDAACLFPEILEMVQVANRQLAGGSPATAVASETGLLLRLMQQP